MPTKIVIVAAGDPDLARTALEQSETGDRPMVIAVDGGAALACALGLPVALAIGDFDSLAADALAELEAGGAEIRRFPADKDATDLELALEAAMTMAPTATATPGPGDVETVVVGVEGDRPDHALAAHALLARPRYGSLGIRIGLAAGTAWPVHAGRTRTLPLADGALVSVIPMLGPAVVSVEGARWPLDRHRLDGGSTRGVSNEASGGPVAVSVHEGVAMVVVPRPGTPREKFHH